MIPEFTPSVGEMWIMKLPFSQTKTIDVTITEQTDKGWKVESESGWTGMGVVFGRDWFIKQILNT